MTTKFDIPGQPPSVNSLLQVDRRTGEWTLRKEAILWRMQAQPYIPAPKCQYDGKKLRFTMAVHRDWLCKNGSMVRADVANLEKFVHDTVARKFGFDDKWIWEKTSRKVQDTVWNGVKCEVSII